MGSERGWPAVAPAVALTLALGLAAPARAGYDEAATEPDFVAVAADALVLRPLGLATLGLGSALFVVTLPFAVGGGQLASMAETLVAEPAGYTFTRPLGDF